MYNNQGPRNSLPKNVDTSAPAKKQELDDMINRLCLDGILEYKVAQDRCSRAVWGLLLLTAIAMGIFQCWQTVQTYRYSPILTTTKILVNETMEFPDIYICPMNAIDKTKAPTDEYIDLAQKFLMANQMKNKVSHNAFHLCMQQTTDVPVFRTCRTSSTDLPQIRIS
jgi:hypothetical protein